MRVFRTISTREAYAPFADPRLDATARGVLGFLLSLEDGAQIDVKGLCEAIPGLGRKAASDALNDLEAAGYYVRRTDRDAAGRVRTMTAVRDTAHVAPIPDAPGTGRPAVGVSGSNPKGFKGSRGVITPPTPHDREPVLYASDSAVEAPTSKGEASDPDIASAAALIAQVAREAYGCVVSQRDAERLATLVVEWRNRGARDRDIRAALTAGLPPTISSPVGLMRKRLTDKMPPVPAPKVAVTPLVDCEGGCGRTAPRGKTMCGDCKTADGRQAPTAQSRRGQGFAAYKAARAALKISTSAA